jgi:hypothetical protein
MEITLTIPQNKWAKPTEVRQEVVQLICDTFLKGETWYSLYDAIVKSRYWDKMEFGNNENYGYNCSRKSEKIVKFHECEMRMAFTALQEAGWYFKAFYCYGSISHKCYKLSRENYEKTHNEYIVTDFTEQWD